MTDSGTKCAWVIHESKAVQIHVHNNRRCLYVPRVPGSVKNPHNNNNFESSIFEFSVIAKGSSKIMSELCIACNSPVEDRKYTMICDFCSQRTELLDAVIKLQSDCVAHLLM